MTRLKDIAERAGVSVMTVSKALRDAPDVSATTKARIKALAQQLGYVPDSTAQGLRNRTTKLFGVAVPSCADPFIARVVLAIEERASELGYDLLLAQTLNIPEREEVCIHRFLARRVDGIFLAPVYRLGSEARIYSELEARRVPTVILGHPAPFCSHFVCLEGDDHAGGAAVTSHLLKLGHTRIAFLAGPGVAPWARLRLEGCKKVLREHGLDLDDRLVFPAGRTIEDGAKVAAQMFNEAPDVTAVQAVNDLVAIGFAQQCLAQGIQIPRDLSLAGYGNLPYGEHLLVPLTTVRQPKYRVGAAAVAAMHQILQSLPVDHRAIQAELIVRGSTGPAPAGSPFHPAKA